MSQRPGPATTRDSRVAVTAVHVEHLSEGAELMKKLLVRTVAAAVLSVGMSGVTFADTDSNRCGLETLQGRYVFSATGFVINPATGVVQPKAIVEIIDFNGDGTLAVPAATRSVNGTIIRSDPSVGSYTVMDDCTGTITFEGPAFDIFIAPRGDQAWLIQTNPNNVFQGSATRTSRGTPDEDPR
jgi:hypothetical protein